MKPVKTHEVTTWSGRSYSIDERVASHIRERMEAGAKFITVPDDDEALGATISVSDIKGVVKRQLSISDIFNDQNKLPEGERKFNPLGPGYIKFLAGSIRLSRKLGKGSSKIESKLNDEQRPLVNAELEAQGLDYRV